MNKTFEELSKLFWKNNVVRDAISDEVFTLNFVDFMTNNLYGVSTDHRKIVLYHAETNKIAEILEEGFNEEAHNKRQLLKFIESWKESGLEKPRDYLDKMCIGANR